MVKKTRFLSVVVAINLLLLSACGYQLRQPVNLPAQYAKVQVQVPRQYRQLRASLKEQLELSFIDVVAEGSDANLLIRLDNVSEDNELLTASAAGSPLERVLILKATVNWLDEDGNAVLGSEDFQLRRAYAYDDTAILAKEREAQFLMAELERNLAQRIVIRLRQLGQVKSL